MGTQRRRRRVIGWLAVLLILGGILGTPNRAVMGTIAPVAGEIPVEIDGARLLLAVVEAVGTGAGHPPELMPVEQLLGLKAPGLRRPVDRLQFHDRHQPAGRRRATDQRTAAGTFPHAQDVPRCPQMSGFRPAHWY